MPILVLLSLALQIACAVHVVRTRRELYWIWIILIGSYLGVVIYVIANVLPDLRHDPRARKTASSTSSITFSSRTILPNWMVCVGAAEGLAELLPTGEKLLSATAKAFAPEIRTTARPPSPSGVAMAAMVSSGNILDLRFTIYASQT